MSPPPDPTDPAARPEYEFTADQNRVIDDLAKSLAWVGIPLLVLGVIYAANSGVHFYRAAQARAAAELVPAGLAVLGAVFFFLLSSWTSKAAAAFDRVAHTSGYDVTHLTAALGNLGRTFGLLALLVQIYVAVAVVLLVTSLILALTGGPVAAA